MSEQDIYLRFIDWMNQSAQGITETEVTDSLLKALYTPEEASLLTGLPFLPKPVETLSEMKQIPVDELSSNLDAMAQKGLVYRFSKDGKVYYNLTEFSFPQITAFMNERDDETIKKLASLVNKNYSHGALDLLKEIKRKNLRAIPVKTTIEDQRQIIPYDDVAVIMDSINYFCLSPCACKQRQNFDPDSSNCEYPVEICFHFGQLGRYFAENGMGREVTRKDAEKIVQECADLGLMHAVANVQKGVNILCNCCKCCCGYLQVVHKFKHAKGMDSSSYVAQTNHETCKGCGLCVSRCHMEARRLESLPGGQNGTKKVAFLKEELCIGCGVCAYKCPTNSITLRRREIVEEPPLNPIEHGKLIMSDLQAARAKKQASGVSIIQG